MSDDLLPTPEGQLVRRVREMAVPRLSIRAAAASIGMSPEQWGYAERGYTPGRGGKPPRRFRPPTATLARMAHAVGVTPERLEHEGGRPDAADILHDMLRSEPQQSGSPAPPERPSEGEILLGVDKAFLAAAEAILAQRSKPAHTRLRELRGLLREWPDAEEAPGRADVA